MTRPNLMIFDDGGGRWGPLCDLRPAFELRTGALTTRLRIERAIGARASALFVPPQLAPLVRERERAAGVAVNEWPDVSGSCLLVNGRWPALDDAPAVRGLEVGGALVDAAGGIVAAHLSPVQAQAFGDRGEWPRPEEMRVTELTGRQLLDRPWHILERLESALRADIDALDLPAWRGKAGVSAERGRGGARGGHPIKAAPDARVHAMTVLNAEKGPIAIDKGAIVGSFTVIAGPCYIGPRTIVSPHTHVRANTSLGPDCVAAGEISHSVIHGRSNKSHAGYLGHSLVGEWVNLGADTNVSNLKNTYGTVRMQLEPGEPAEDSGQPKLGPVVGDFVRTAIGSRLMTGSCLGTGVMLAVSGFAPKFAEPLTFHTDEGVEPYDAEKFLATARRMMSRRGVELSEALEQRLRELAQTPVRPAAG